MARWRPILLCLAALSCLGRPSEAYSFSEELTPKKLLTAELRIDISAKRVKGGRLYRLTLKRKPALSRERFEAMHHATLAKIKVNKLGFAESIDGVRSVPLKRIDENTWQAVFKATSEEVSRLSLEFGMPYLSDTTFEGKKTKFVFSSQLYFFRLRRFAFSK